MLIHSISPSPNSLRSLSVSESQGDEWNSEALLFSYYPLLFSPLKMSINNISLVPTAWQWQPARAGTWIAHVCLEIGRLRELVMRGVETESESYHGLGSWDFSPDSSCGVRNKNVFFHLKYSLERLCLAQRQKAATWPDQLFLPIWPWNLLSCAALCWQCYCCWHFNSKIRHLCWTNFRLLWGLGPL